MQGTNELSDKNLTCSGMKDYFEALQEKSSQDQYGDILGQIACFYLRELELESDEEEEDIVQWYQQHPLNPSQQKELENLSNVINNGSDDIKLLDTVFHKAVKELLLKWLAMRLIQQYHVDVWAGLYAWSYEFVGKNKE